MTDLVFLLTFHWGTECVPGEPCGNECPADLDGDGVVGVNDLVELIVAWGDCG